MSNNFVNQVTLDCLLNKELYNKHIQNKRAKSLSNQHVRFYRKRIYNLFKELLVSKEEPPDLLPDVKLNYDNFLYSCINYFRTIDNNDLIQSEYKDINNSYAILDNIPHDDTNIIRENSDDADKLLMRSIKINSDSTLDKYVKKTSTAKKEEIIMPIQKVINLEDPELKNKGIKKKNITN
jgi:hypothetical protein